MLSGDVAQAAANSTAAGPTSCTAETDNAAESNASPEHGREHGQSSETTTAAQERGPRLAAATAAAAAATHNPTNPAETAPGPAKVSTTKAKSTETGAAEPAETNSSASATEPAKEPASIKAGSASDPKAFSEPVTAEEAAEGSAQAAAETADGSSPHAAGSTAPSRQTSIMSLTFINRYFLFVPPHFALKTGGTGYHQPTKWHPNARPDNFIRSPQSQWGTNTGHRQQWQSLPDCSDQ